MAKKMKIVHKLSRISTISTQLKVAEFSSLKIISKPASLNQQKARKMITSEEINLKKS